MKAILLDGSLENDKTEVQIREELMAQLQAKDWDVEHIVLREEKIGNCAGDFFCWIRSPGMCNVDDDNRLIAETLVTSDLMIYLTPVTFGGYSSALKRMVDHEIQNVSPFFTKIEGETHHHKRYTKNPDLLVVGWMDQPDGYSEAVFRHLVQRNGINFHANTCVSGVVFAGQSDEEVQALVQMWLKEIEAGHSSQRSILPAKDVRSTTAETDTDQGSIEIRRALLLVGSPKTRKSSSNSLGGYLFDQLTNRSIQTKTIYVHTVLRNSQKMQAFLDALDAADLVVLAFPIYVDSQPAPVVEALERIAEHRLGRDPARRQLFAAIANCGFPEAHHCDTALAIVETFAREAWFEWAGSLALGGGQMLNGKPLAEAGGMTIRIRQALDLAAEGLAKGQAIPDQAKELMARPIIPHWVYRLTAGLGWIQSAKGYGALTLLRRRPYLAKAG